MFLKNNKDKKEISRVNAYFRSKTFHSLLTGFLTIIICFFCD